MSGMDDIQIRREIVRALEWLGASPEQVDKLADGSKRELYAILEALDADRYLLATVGSWIEEDEEFDVLRWLRAWNSEQVTDAIEAVRVATEL